MASPHEMTREPLKPISHNKRKRQADSLKRMEFYRIYDTEKSKSVGDIARELDINRSTAFMDINKEFV